MKVTVEKPKIITLLYRQENTDEDYGSCLWARFYLDLENFTMAIESDCGNYSYGWPPTPKTEPFLHLLNRMGKDYLLNKIASLSVVDGDATWENVEEYIQEAAAYEGVFLTRTEWYDLRAACYIGDDVRDVMEAIEDALPSELFEELDYSYVWGLVEQDFSTQAKRIVSIFDSYIRPKIKDLMEEESHG